MKKTLKRSLVMILATVLLIGTFAVTADAAMKKTVKKQKFTTSTSTINKKAAKVKKGTTNLTIKKGQGYIKFVAPKTKTYSFTFSNVKSSYGSCGFVEIQKKDPDSPQYCFLEDVKTKGGKDNTLWLSVSGHKFTQGKMVDRPLAKRTGKIKLKKGEALYMYFYNGDKKTTAKLVIK